MALKHQAAVIGVMSAYRRFVADLAAELKPLGLSPDACLVLFLLDGSADQTTTQLADALCLNLPTATKLIDRMVSDNLVHRKPHQSDRRQINILLTRDGEKKLKEASIAFDKFCNALPKQAISRLRIKA